MKKPTTLSVLLLAQRELRDFYSRDSKSQALRELKDKIEELQNEEKLEETISFLNLSPKELPLSLQKKIVDNELYTYMDTHDLLEHLYSVDGIIDKAQKNAIVLTKKETDILDKLQIRMNEKNCGYFRIIKF